MDFIEFMKEHLPNGYKTTFHSELSFIFDDEIDNVVIRLNEGNRYQRGVVIPLTIFITTKNINQAKNIWSNWVASVSDKDYNSESAEENYYMMFQTPTVIQMFDEISNNYYQVLSIYGTIVETYGILDIKKLEIDGIEVDINEMSYQLVNQPDISQTIDDSFSETTIQNSVLSFNVTTFLADYGALSSKLKNMRKGIISSDTGFAVKFTFNDGDTEQNTMKLITQSIVKSRGSISLLSLSFSR